MNKLSASTLFAATLAAALAGASTSAFAQDATMSRVEVRAVTGGAAGGPNPLDYGIFLVDVSENTREMVVAELMKARASGEFTAPKPQDYGIFLQA